MKAWLYRKVTNAELTEALDKIRDELHENLERGSKIMRKHDEELFPRPNNFLGEYSLFNKWFGLPEGRREDEPKSRVKQLEDKLDAVCKALKINVYWDGSVEKKGYVVTKPKQAKKGKK